MPEEGDEKIALLDDLVVQDLLWVVAQLRHRFVFPHSRMEHHVPIAIVSVPASKYPKDGAALGLKVLRRCDRDVYALQLNGV